MSSKRDYTQSPDGDDRGVYATVAIQNYEEKGVEQVGAVRNTLQNCRH